MELITNNQTARYHFDLDGKKSISDRFTVNGRIGVISFRVNSKNLHNRMRMRVGNVKLTMKDFSGDNIVFHPHGVIEYMLTQKKKILNVERNMIFYFEQTGYNVTEIDIWMCQVEEIGIITKKENENQCRF